MHLLESPRIAGILVAVFIASVLLAGAFGITVINRIDNVVTTTHTLLTDGKSVAARDAEQANASAKLASQAESNAVKMIDASLAHDHLTGLGNKVVLCAIAAKLQISVTTYCPGVK